MSTANQVSQTGGVNLAFDPANVDLGTLMFTVQAERANILDSQVRQHAQEIRNKNDMLKRCQLFLGDVRSFKQSLEGEVTSSNNYKSMMDDYKSKNWAIGRHWPSGELTADYTWFQNRGMTMHTYVRGNISVGDPSAYDNNKNLLDGYINGVQEGTATLPAPLQTKFTALQSFFTAQGISFGAGLKNMQSNLDNLQSQIGSLTSNSQLDMAQLQSIMGKFNQTYEAISNFVNKNQGSLNTITGNLR